jgi:formiminoglutamase
MIEMPFILSVPHAGLRVPEEVKDLCILSADDIRADGDEGASDIYGPLEGHVSAFLTTDIARAIVDLNRAQYDRRPDGVVKTQTCWQVPVYRSPPAEETVRKLIERYYLPYYERLRSESGGMRLGIDCHTMAATGPPIGPDPEEARPRACIGNGGGSCPVDWAEEMARLLREEIGDPVTVNRPFAGGYITRSRPGSIPWMQIELSRSSWIPDREKSAAVLAVLRRFFRAARSRGFGSFR